MTYIIVFIILFITLAAAFYYEISHSYDDDKFRK